MTSSYLFDRSKVTKSVAMNQMNCFNDNDNYIS